MLDKPFVEYLGNSIIKNWGIKALSDYKGEDFTYADVAKQIIKFHILFENAGIVKGDKIALVAKNSAQWGITYLAVVTYGAVIVPILADFKPDDIHSIVNHSDSVLMFCSDSIYQTLDNSLMANLIGIISVYTFELIYSHSEKLTDEISNLDKTFAKKFVSGLTAETFNLPKVPNGDLAVISYTSGTTGFSKGVMLQHNSLAANIRFAQNNMPLNPGDPIVSFLPLAHTYGGAFEFLFPFSIGCHITFLTKTPSPQIVIQAFQDVKPALVLSVPLVIEKIFKKQILPVIEKPLMKIMLKVPVISKLIAKKINQKLTQTFGGNFSEIVIGGAPFNFEAESFFKKIKFRFTVGYGMTECGPLISYTSWRTNKLGASGKPVDTLEAKIDSDDPENKVGEIILRGENVMLGYYKNEEATKEIIDEDGWLHTGDLGLMDKEGNIFIKGRCKSLILGANGKNIYPEEIEASINNKYCVNESLVVHREDKLVALIFPDLETIESNGITTEELHKILEQHRKEINSSVPAYISISKFELHPEEFIKTPKRSIKRYLYK